MRRRGLKRGLQTDEEKRKGAGREQTDDSRIGGEGRITMTAHWWIMVVARQQGQHRLQTTQIDICDKNKEIGAGLRRERERE